MLRLILLSAAIFLFQKNSCAQFFNKKYMHNGLDFSWSVVYSSNIVFTASTAIINSNEWRLILTKYNLNGLIINQDSIYGNNKIFGSSLAHTFKSINTGFIISSGYKNFQDSILERSYFIKFNSNLDTSFLKFYTNSTHSGSYNSFLFEGNKYGIIGTTTDSIGAKTDINMIKIDTNGSVIWNRRYGDPNYQEIAYTAFEDNDGSIVMAGKKFFNGVDPYHPLIIRTDSAGTLIDQKEFINLPFNLGAMYISKRLNGNYFVYGTLDTLGLTSSQNHPVYIGELDYNFNFLWYKTLPFRIINTIYNLKELADSTIIICGNVGDTLIPHSGWLAKFSKTGTMLWEHFYQYPNSTFNILADFTTLPNGDIVASGGTLVPGETQDVWLLRVDSNGCEMPNCITSVAPEPKSESVFEVFPNPTTGEFIVESFDKFKMTSFKIGDAFEVYDIMGRKILTQKITDINSEQKISLANDASGIYLLRIVRNGKILFKEKIVKE